MQPSPDNERVLAELRALPIGEAVGREHLARMARIGSVEQFGAGTRLFRGGQPALDLRFVVSGRVCLTLEVTGQAPMLVATLSRGDLLGWSALQGWSSPSTWSASATACKPTTCLRFPGAELRELCEQDHELGFHVMRHAFDVLSRRLRDCCVQLLDVYGNGR